MLGGMNDCTIIVLSNLSADDANGAEHSMVDGMVELTMTRSFQRTLREVEVDLAHRATGTDARAQVHRARQLADVALALATRL